jgi:hypothetical protein
MALNPSYTGGQRQEDHVLRKSLAKMRDHIRRITKAKRASHMAQIT